MGFRYGGTLGYRSADRHGTQMIYQQIVGEVDG